MRNRVAYCGNMVAPIRFFHRIESSQNIEAQSSTESRLLRTLHPDKCGKIYASGLWTHWLTDDTPGSGKRATSGTRRGSDLPHASHSKIGTLHMPSQHTILNIGGNLSCSVNVRFRKLTNRTPSWGMLARTAQQPTDPFIVLYSSFTKVAGFGRELQPDEACA